MFDYNIHNFLYDLLHVGTHHFKSYLLCKLGYHNYQLHRKKIKLNPEIIKEQHQTTVKNKFKFIQYYECYCCKKRIEVKEYV